MASVLTSETVPPRWSYQSRGTINVHPVLRRCVGAAQRDNVHHVQSVVLRRWFGIA